MLRFSKTIAVVATLLTGTSLVSVVFAQETASPSRIERLEVQMGQSDYQTRTAQLFGRPPGSVGNAQDDEDAPRSPGIDRVQDASGLLLRVDRLENQMRSLNGQIEQMQFQNRRLEEQLKKFQQDVEFRFQERGGAGQPQVAPRPNGQKRTDAGDMPPTVAQPAVLARDPMTSATPAATTPRKGRGDAFDPAAQPNAPGAPRNIGALSNPGAEVDPNAPMDLSRGAARPVAAASPPVANYPGVLPGVPGQAGTGVERVTPGGTVIAGAPPATPQSDYEIAYGYLKAGQYETAEKGFSSFLQKSPRDRMVANAHFYLGESYFQRGRHREAAEQYLKVSTEHSKSAKAPEAMLRLGVSLNALGAKEQACATFGEITRKYPTASPTVRAGAERETKRAQC